MQQGALGNCGILASLSALTADPEMLKSLFETQEINQDCGASYPDGSVVKMAKTPRIGAEHGRPAYRRVSTRCDSSTRRWSDGPPWSLMSSCPAARRAPLRAAYGQVLRQLLAFTPFGDFSKNSWGLLHWEGRN